jgi:hypothetical protein
MDRVEELSRRLGTLEYRSFNRRFYAVEQIAEYLVGAEIGGDYLEFGVYRGATFLHAYRHMSAHFAGMNFVAFDSFEGLPEPGGVDAHEGYTSNFRKSEFRCTEEEFRTALREAEVDPARIRIVKGWFCDTLGAERAEDHGISKVAAAWIDCDLYESTVPVLDFLTPRIGVGTVVAFDDWRCFRNHPDFGEQRACREWLERNPAIRLSELLSFGWNGIAFSVTAC